MNPTKISSSLALILAVASTTAAHAAPPAQPAPPARQPRPTSWPAEVSDVFFKDAREHLKGDRPQPARNPGDGAATHAPQEGVQQAERFAWSRLVDGDALATEVKRIASHLHDPVASAPRFQADGFKQCRADFGQLAVLFAVIAEYDGEVRWRDQAPAMRDALASASRHCKKATDKSFAEATARVADLDEIVRGGRLPHNPSKPLAKWSALADRSVLMLRMQTAWRDNISPQLSDAPRFAKAAIDIRHEAQLLAIWAEVIHRNEYDYSDDAAFAAYARELQDAAKALSTAASQGNYEAARHASARAGQACVACHDDYRG